MDGMTFGPINTIIAAGITGLVSFGIALLFVHKRKRVLFLIEQGEDLTLVLRQNYGNMVFKVGDKEMSNFNRCGMVVVNTGNVAIKDFDFDIYLDEGRNLLVHKITPDTKLCNSISLAQEDRGGAWDHKVTVSLPFFNARESFKVRLYYEGVTKDCSVECRMEDVRIRMRRAEVYKEFAVEIAQSLAFKTPIIGNTLAWFIDAYDMRRNPKGRR